MNRFFSFFALCCFLSFQTKANEAFENALKATVKQEYAIALKIFDSIIQKEPTNLSAIINSGNCYFYTKQYGKAVHRYETALKLSPGEMELVQSIEACYLALGKTDSYIPPFNALDILLYRIGSVTWATLSIAFALLLAWAVFRRLSHNSDGIFSSFAFIAICAVLLIGSAVAGVQVHKYTQGDHFAIVSKSTTPLLLNEQGELSGLQLTEGTRVSVVDSKNSFLEIIDQSGQRYLIRKSDILLF
ncbi:MAG: tetratricopeptide repeat protein [Bacteroidota bacterium]|jgi:tetratricopeptide (TPR) repeat protein